MYLQRLPVLVLATALLLGALVWSGWQPFDRTTWVLEVFPIFLVLPLLWATQRRFPLTGLLYLLIFLHALVLIIGGMYSYAQVPFGFVLAEWFDLDRNPYDKIGHFFQGLVPALAAREILLRGQWVRGRRMLGFVVLCVVLAISAAYELVEWLAALLLGQGAEDFLGTQGDPWDTQSDMFWALLGGLTTLMLLARRHDQQLQQLI
jgi:putative membrane protein